MVKKELDKFHAAPPQLLPRMTGLRAAPIQALEDKGWSGKVLLSGTGADSQPSSESSMALN